MDKAKIESTNIISKILITLYLVVGLSPKVVELEYEGFQWFYFSALNLASLIFIYTQKEVLNPLFLDKKASRFFLIFLAFLLVAFLSLTQALNVSEGLVQISRIVNVAVGVYAFYVLFRLDPATFFEYISIVCTILLAYHSYVTLKYFWGNFDKPRTVDFYKGFIHYYGNINFFTASLILKIPFALYLFLNKKGLWRFITAVVFFTTVLSLFYSGSRTAILSLIIIVFAQVLYIYFNKKEENKLKLVKSLFLIVVPLFAVYVFTNTNRLYRGTPNSISDITTFTKDDYKNTDRLLSKNPGLNKTEVKVNKIEDSSTFEKILKKSGRGNIWKAAIKIFGEHPLLGVGYGNYKVYPKPEYFLNRKKSKGSYGISIRVHNDFLEKFVEAGILGGILYIMLFVFILMLIIYLLKNKQDSGIVFTLLLSAIAYSLDAFFNFPLERAPIQLFFVLIAGLLLAVYFKNNIKEVIPVVAGKELKQIGYFSAITIVLISVVANHMVYKAYVENTIFKNTKVFKKRGYNISYSGFKNRVKNSFPDLDQDGIKMDYYAASYATLEKKYDTSLDILNEAIVKEDVPQNYLLKKLKAELFLKGYKNLDSAQYYYYDVFKSFPGYKHNYLMLKNIHKGKKETDKLEKLMDSYTWQNYVDFNEWIQKAEYYYHKTRKIQKGIQVLDTALAYNKDNYEILKAKLKLSKYNSVGNYYQTEATKKKYAKAIALYNKTKYKDALKMFYDLLKENPQDYYAVQYIGITEMNLKNYKTAVKYLSETISKNIFKDGKAEYCRGLSYEKLGEIEKSKKDYRASRKKKFPQALKLKPTKYE